MNGKSMKNLKPLLALIALFATTVFAQADMTEGEIRKVDLDAQKITIKD